MFDLPNELRPLLATVLCIQVPVEETVLICILGSSVSELLEVAVSKGLLLSQTVHEGENKTTVYYSVDDTIEASLATALFSSDNSQECRDDWHQKIGRRLIRAGTNTQLAIDQFLCAHESILNSASDDTRYSIADACLEAGREAAQKRDFQLATKDLNFGVQLVSRCPRHWKNMYDLSLSLHQAAAEANQCVSDYDTAMNAIEAVKANSRSFHDTLIARASEIVILGALGRRKEAVRVGMEILGELGHPLPKHRKRYHGMLRLRQLRRQLKGKTNEMILRMPNMIDEEIGHTMKILELLFTISFSVEPVMLLLIVGEMVRLTIKHGLCNVSAPAFATFGMLLGGMGDTERALRFGKLGLELYERFPVKEWLPRTYLAVYGGILSTIKTREANQALLRAHRVGLETGDIEIAFVLAHAYTHTLVILGTPFPEIKTVGSRFLEDARNRNQVMMTKIFSVSLQFFDNLIGNAADPTLMVGNYFDEFDKTDGLASLKTSTVLPLFFHMCKMMLAYLLGEYKLATKHSKLCYGIENFPSGHVAFTNASMFKSLTIIALCHATDRKPRRTLRKVKPLREKLKKQAKILPSVCSSKLFLVDAEVSWLTGKNDAYFHFRNAINCASSEGMLLDEALANERLGWYLLDRDDDDAMKFFAAARDAYQRAGIGVKVKQLDQFIKTKVTTARKILTACGVSVSTSEIPSDL